MTVRRSAEVSNHNSFFFTSRVIALCSNTHGSRFGLVYVEFNAPFNSQSHMRQAVYLTIVPGKDQYKTPIICGANYPFTFTALNSHIAH